MSRETINLICADLPGAERSDPQGGGPDAWTVGGEMFARIDAETPGVSVRTADVATAEMMIAAGVARPAPAFDGTWVDLPLESPDAELHDRIAESYTLVRKALPQAIQVTLDRTSG